MGRNTYRDSGPRGNDGRPAWWAGVIYQIYPRSFADSNGDGIGDLEGIRRKIPYLSDVLGVDAVWLSPFYPSPQKDFGYDVSDYVDVASEYGTLEDFDRLVDDLHAVGIRLIIDFVPNHSSDQHPWFRESASSPDNPKRDWYVWRDPKPDGSEPNNWLSLFGGRAWEWHEPTMQYYLHSFLKEQPDLNWRSPEVEAAMFDALRFWLDRGVDGFRIDVAHFIMKDPEMRDNPLADPGARSDHHKPMGEYETLDSIHSKGHPDIHPLYRRLRAVVDAYEDRYMVGEVHITDWSEWATYFGANLDEMHQPYNFALLSAATDTASVRAVVSGQEAVLPPGAWPNYVLGNHDEPRIPKRYGQDAIRRLAVLLLTLRGTPTIYYGDELGMLEGSSDTGLDPWGRNVEGVGRDGCRTPMQWTPEGGFSSSARTWLPMGPESDTRNVESELADPGSVLNLYRRLIAVRKSSEALMVGEYRELAADHEDVLMFERQAAGERVVVAVNFGSDFVNVAVNGDVLVSTDLRGGFAEEAWTLEPHGAVVVRG